MRMLLAGIAAAALAGSAAAAPITPLQRETAVWRAVKAKRMAEFTASMTPDFVGMYAFGRHDRAAEVRVVRNQVLRSFVLSDFRVVRIDADDMLMTYAADVKGTDDGEDFSGRYWNTSLWHRIHGKWLTSYHGEARAR